MKNRFHSLDWDIIDFRYPLTCGGCKKPVVWWCGNCQCHLKEIQRPIGVICGQFIKKGNRCPCYSKPRQRIKALRSMADFRIFRDASHDLKYRKNVSLRTTLVTNLGEEFFGTTDAVTLMPGSNQCLNQRGYHQATFITKPLAYTLQLPYNPGTHMSIRESEIKLSLFEQKIDMKSALEGPHHKVREKRIIVIDHATSSYYALEAFASALLDGRASAVYRWTVSQAIMRVA